MRIFRDDRRIPTGAVLLFAVGLLFLNSPVPGQTLDIRRVHLDWPQVEVYYEVFCGSTQQYGIAPTNISLTENGWDVTSFSQSCPDTATPCTISAALVLDASGSMAGPGNTELKKAGHAFVDSLNGSTDEAAVLFYNSVVTMQQQMTTVKPLLHTAIDALPASGGTAIWDGAYAGVLEVINNGVNSCRVVILVTDGMDNSSTHTPQEIIALAADHHIRVFTVALGGSIDSTPLKMLADLTGGRYRQTNTASNLTAIFSEIHDIIRDGFRECVVTYQSGCPDGALREVRFVLSNVCGGNTVDTAWYRAPLDTTAFADMQFELTELEVESGGIGTMQLRLVSALNNAQFEPFRFRLTWDGTVLDLLSHATPANSLWSGLTVDAMPIQNGLEVEVQTGGYVSGPGLLMEFTFRALVNPVDTVCADVLMLNAQFERGCYRPMTDSGELCILPGAPSLSCILTAPKELIWQRAIRDYYPNPFPVQFRLLNTGNAAAKNVRFKLSDDAGAFTLENPVTDTISASPPDLPPGQETAVGWTLRAKPRLVGDSSRIIITASADNAPDQSCEVRIYIPPAEPDLRCTVSVPTLTVDLVNHRYNPNPFPVEVLVENVFGLRTDTVFARLELPPGLSFAGADAPDNHTKRTLPSLLYSQQTGMAQWMVSAPTTTFERVYTIVAWIRTANADSTRCEAYLTVPPMDAPILAPRCHVPDSLRYDAALDAYLPNPFSPRITCVNNGSIEARNVDATIVLPPDIELDPPGQPITKRFNPSTLEPLKIGDPIPELQWTVRWPKRYRHDVTVPLCFVITGELPDGKPMDTVRTCCDLRIVGLQPTFSCEIDIPDSLVLNSQGTEVEPNPFTVRYTVMNTGYHAGVLSRIAIEYGAHDGFSLNPASPNPLSRDMNLAINRGDDATFEWLIDVENRPVSRATTIRVTAWDDEGNPILCEDVMQVPAIETRMTCDLRVEPDTLRCIATPPYVHPERFVVTALLHNIGSSNINNILAELSWTESSPGLIEWDPTYSPNQNPRGQMVLFTNSQVMIPWGLVVKTISDTATHVQFRVRVTSDNAPELWSGHATLHIDPRPPQLRLAPLGPTSFCEGESVLLDAGGGWAAYEWNTGDTTRLLNVRQAGDYFVTVTLTDGSGCPARSDTVSVVVHPLPPKPVVTLIGNELSTDSASAWQWYRDSVEIPGATGRTLTALMSGYYRVRVENVFGCSSMSDSLFVSVLGIDGPAAAAERFMVYPNPTTGAVTVLLSGVRSGSAEFIVSDLLGRELFRRRVDAEGGQLRLRFDLAQQRPAVYFLHADVSGNRYTRMVVLRPR